MPAIQNDPATGGDAPLDMSLRLERGGTVSDQVYDALRHAIVTVRVLPGASISENRICRSLGVSRTPVRSAIVRLAEDGLIDVYPQKGSFVAPIRLAAIAESRFIRRVLEVAVVRDAGAVWNATHSAAARAAIAEQARAIAAGESEAFFRADEHFHHIFSLAAGHEGAWAAIVQANSRLGRFHRLFGNKDRLPVVLQEHTGVIDALDAGEVDRAAHRLEDHIDKVFTLIDHLPEDLRRLVEG